MIGEAAKAIQEASGKDIGVFEGKIIEAERRERRFSPTERFGDEEERGGSGMGGEKEPLRGRNATTLLLPTLMTKFSNY